MAKDSNKKEDLRALGFNPSIYFNSYAMGGDLEEGTPDLSAYETTYGDLPPELEYYMRMPGVNPDKVMAWFNLGINEPQTYNQAKLLAEAVGYNPEQAKVVAGQWQFESSGGSRLSSPYNYFGIKSHNEAVRNKLAERGINVSAGKEAGTTEGAGTKTKSSFMEFNNAFEGFAAHRAFLETNQRYQKALASPTAKDFAIGLEKAGYATAPNYGTRLYEDYVVPKEKNPESGDNRPKSFGITKSEQLKPSTSNIKPEVHINQMPTLAPEMMDISPEISKEPTTSSGMYGSIPYETEVKTTKPISMTAPKGWFGSDQSIFKQGGSMNFKQNAMRGHMYAQGGFNNPGFQALPVEVQNKIKSRSFAQGGSMDPLTEFNAGGSHEQNPMGGIPQGTAPDGKTNLVEQGETKLNVANYIFSDKIKVDKDIAKELNLPKNAIGKTFAEVSKNINSRNGNSRREKGYDSIEDKARDTELETLMNAQELQKQMQMQADMQEMMSKYPEEMGALLQGGAPGGQMAMSPEDQMAAQQDMAMQQGTEGAPSPEEIAMMQQQGGAPMDPAMMQQMAASQGGGEIIPASELPMSYGGSMYMRGGKMCSYGGNMYDFGGFVDDNSAGLAGAGTGALSGAATGAMLGAATGPLAFIGAPVGAAIGGVVGGVSGFMGGHKQDKAEEETRQTAQQQQLAQSNQMNYAPQSPYVTPAATNTMGTYAKGGPLYKDYKYGGSFDMPRQQMYMPLDNVERMGGHIYDGLSTPNNYMSYVPQASSLLTNPWTRDNFTLGNYNTTDFTKSGSTGTTTNKSTDHYDVDTTLTDTTQDISTKGTAWDVLANAAPIAYNAYQALSKSKAYNAKDFYTPMEAIRPDYTQAENEARYTYANLMDSVRSSGLSGGNYASNAQNAANMRNKAMGQVAMAEEDAFRQDQAHVRDINTSAYDKARAAALQLNLATQTAKQEHGKEAITGVKDWREQQISNDLAMQYAALGAPDITKFTKFGYTPYSEILREKYLNTKGK